MAIRKPTLDLVDVEKAFDHWKSWVEGLANVLDIEEIGRRSTLSIPHAAASTARTFDADVHNERVAQITPFIRRFTYYRRRWTYQSRSGTVFEI